MGHKESNQTKPTTFSSSNCVIDQLLITGQSTFLEVKTWYKTSAKTSRIFTHYN